MTPELTDEELSTAARSGHATPFGRAVCALLLAQRNGDSDAADELLGEKEEPEVVG